MQAHQQDTRLLRLPKVIEKCGISKTEIYRRVGEGTFPRPVPLSTPDEIRKNHEGKQITPRASAWLAAEVEGWIAARIAARMPRAA